MPRLTFTPTGAVFADVEPPADETVASIPGALAARSAWLSANRTAARRAYAARYARAELEQLQREGVAVPILRDAAKLADHRDRLAQHAAEAAFGALRRFDRLTSDAAVEEAEDLADALAETFAN